jgi:hypothetical protein
VQWTRKGCEAAALSNEKEFGASQVVKLFAVSKAMQAQTQAQDVQQDLGEILCSYAPQIDPKLVDTLNAIAESCRCISQHLW